MKHFQKHEAPSLLDLLVSTVLFPSSLVFLDDAFCIYHVTQQLQEMDDYGRKR
jgi:hypothetical protein